MTYGVFACGYRLNSMDHLSPDDYHRALYGLDEWLQREKGKRWGTILEPGTFKYYEKLLDEITYAMFIDQEVDDLTFRDSPRNIWTKRIRPNVKDRRPFLELADEKTFKEFLYACLEGGEHHKRSSYFFSVKDVGRTKVEKLELTFNPECIPSPELTPEERDKLLDHCAELMMGTPLIFKDIPVETDLQTQLEDQYQAARAAHENDPYCGDENARAEAECEYQD